jgi:hypothetical protein
MNLIGCGSAENQGESSSETADSPVTAEQAMKQASKILKKMTLEEKIGQMIFVDADRLTEADEAVTETTTELL